MLQQDKENHQNKWLCHCNVVYRKTIYRGITKDCITKPNKKSCMWKSVLKQKNDLRIFYILWPSHKIIKKITYQRNIIKILEYRELVVEVSIRSPQWQLMLNNQNHWRSKHDSPVPWDQAWEPLSVPRPSLGHAVSSDWLSPSPRSAVLVAVATPLALFVLPLASPQSALVCPWIPVNSTDLVKGDYNI